MKPDASAYGTISAQNTNPASGTPTANSTVSLNVDGMSTLVVQTASSNLNQPLTVQGSIDGQNWITLGGLPLINMNTGIGVATIPASTNGLFQVDVSGLRYARLSQITAANTGSAVVSMNATATDGVIGLDTPIPAGSAQIGLVGTPSGSAHTLTSAATTNGTSVKTSAANLFELTIDNLSASPRYLKLYNKASAPTVGTDVPILTIPVAAGTQAQLNFGQIGKRFVTGLAFAITGAAAVTDTTAIAAGDTHSSLSYI